MITLFVESAFAAIGSSWVGVAHEFSEGGDGGDDFIFEHYVCSIDRRSI